MQVLSRKKQLMIAVALAGLTGCDQRSTAYNQITNLPEAKWNEYAATLPIERHIDLHKEIMERSGHNPTRRIDASFSGRSEEAYKAIVRRLLAGDQSRHYLGIIYEIDGSEEFYICNQPDRKIVQDYLGKITGYPGHDKLRPKFYSC